MESACVTFLGTQVRPESIISLYWGIAASLSLIAVLAVRKKFERRIFTFAMTGLLALCAFAIASFQPLLAEFKTHAPPNQPVIVKSA